MTVKRDARRHPLHPDDRHRGEFPALPKACFKASVRSRSPYRRPRNFLATANRPRRVAAYACIWVSAFGFLPEKPPEESPWKRAYSIRRFLFLPSPGQRPPRYAVACPATLADENNGQGTERRTKTPLGGATFLTAQFRDNGKALPLSEETFSCNGHKPRGAADSAQADGAVRSRVRLCRERSTSSCSVLEPRAWPLLGRY